MAVYISSDEANVSMTSDLHHSHRTRLGQNISTESGLDLDDREEELGVELQDSTTIVCVPL